MSPLEDGAVTAVEFNAPSTRNVRLVEGRRGGQGGCRCAGRRRVAGPSLPGRCPGEYGHNYTGVGRGGFTWSPCSKGGVTGGRFRPAGPALDAVAMLGRESVVARSPDRIFFEVGPVLLLIAALLGRRRAAARSGSHNYGPGDGRALRERGARLRDGGAGDGRMGTGRASTRWSAAGDSWGNSLDTPCSSSCR